VLWWPQDLSPGRRAGRWGIRRRATSPRGLLGRSRDRCATFTLTPRAAQPGVAFAPREQRGNLAQLSASKSAELEQWLAGAPVLQTQDTALAHTYRASLSDLGALRLHPDLFEGDPARGGAAVIHGALRARQPDHKLPGAALPGASVGAMPTRRL
jgi:hypothetical protein